MKQILLATGLCLASACTTTQTKPHAPVQELVERIEREAAIDPIDPLPLLIADALAKDKNVVRAYLAQKPSDSGQPVYVLAPIFENEYPQEAISAAYSVFYQVVPNGKLELWLVPMRDYKKHFAKAQPIYVRP
jgi:hypothetical protein